MGSNLIIVNEDISSACVDVLVNAGNGTGFMGGRQSVKTLCKGVAEHLNYYSNGEAEKAAKEKKRTIRKVFALPVGTVFSTDSCGLPCKTILHAVTMRYAGGRSTYRGIHNCIIKIYEYCESTGASSVAFPLLGCGTGRLKKETVENMIAEEANLHPQITSYLYKPKNEGYNKFHVDTQTLQNKSKDNESEE